MFLPSLIRTRPAASTGGSPSSESSLVAPAGFPTLVYSTTPLASDTTWAGYLARSGMILKFGESPSFSDNYGLASSGQTGIYPAIKITAHAATHGVNGGFVFGGFDPNSVNGGPPHGFFRIKVWHPTGFDFQPVNTDGSRAGAGGTKFAGPWGGLTPSTGNVVTNPGWAARVWSSGTSDYIAPTVDGYSPRTGGAGSGYAKSKIYRAPDGSVYHLNSNLGKWDLYETEVGIETTAGGFGIYRVWVNGVLGIDATDVIYMNPSKWTNQVGVKGVYLQNWWGGGGTAPVLTPIYYRDIELWAP